MDFTTLILMDFEPTTVAAAPFRVAVTGDGIAFTET